MFPCGSCSKTTKPGEKATRMVVETRQAAYPFIPDALHFRRDGKKVVRHDRGGRGVEISKEITVCPRCVTTGGSSA